MAKKPKQELESSSLPDKSNEEVARQKRLSGATMNMKFMKRSKTQHDSKPTRNTTARTSTASTTSATPPQPNHAQSPLQPTTTSTNYSRNIHTNATSSAPSTTTTQPYKTAQPSHMFGVTGSVLGRRSFGGMNEPMQKAWKTSLDRSKGGIQDKDGGKKERLTDEALLQRYQNMVEERSKKVTNRQSRVRISKLKK